MPLDLDSLVAPKGIGPQAGQTPWSNTRPGVGVVDSPDLTRILALPRRKPPTSTEFTALIDRVPGILDIRRDNPACLCREKFDRDCITNLRGIQAWALLEMRTQGGILGAIGTGDGKTIIDLLAAWAIPNCKRAVLLVPVKLIKQLIRNYLHVGQHFKMPTLITHDATQASFIVAGAPAVHVLPYSKLQRPESTSYLEELAPDVIFADEVHKLKCANTATTGRLLRYFKNHPETRFCGWSGSITDKSIKDYGHLAALALRAGSPVPIDPDTLDDWSGALDPPARGDDLRPEGALIKLCAPGEHVREAYGKRLQETPGWISTTQPIVDVPLQIDQREVRDIPDSVAAALRQVDLEWTRPDGFPIPDAMQRTRCALEVSCGFYYRWRFPHVRGAPQRMSDIDEWKEVRSAWAKEVRAAIKSRKEHFDSERLARNAAERAHGDRPITDKTLPVWKSQTYPEWKRLEHTVVHETEAIWIDDFLARDAAEWALANTGIVWYGMAAFGMRVAELSKLDLHGGGAKAEELILRSARAKDSRSIIASIESHGTGRDELQFKYGTQLIANFPSSNEKCEQLLGRLHRPGTKSDLVSAYFYRHTKWCARSVNQALRRAGYVEATMRAQQKLNIGGALLTDEEDFDDLE